MPIRVFIADDQSLMVEALSNMIESDPELTCVGRALDGVAAIEGVAELQPDIVVMDIGMPRLNGLDATKQIKQSHPKTQIIMLTMNIDPDVAAEAFRAGAKGYVIKSGPATTLIEAIKEVAAGGSYLGPGVEGLALRQAQPLESLTLEDLMDRALAEIVGGFCHDIGNDLEMCLAHIKAHKYTKAHKVGTAAADSLRGLHQFVRQYYFGGGFDSSAVNASSLEGAVQEMCSHAIRDTNITIHVESSALTEELSLPSLLLRHLIVPLAHNAVQAIGLAKRENGFIWLSFSVESPDNVIRITVDDNGIGWEGREEEIEAALKSGHPVSTKGSNRGFGLQNIWRLVSRIGGDIKLNKSPRGGAQVAIYLEMRHTTPESPLRSLVDKSKYRKSPSKLSQRQKEVLQLLAEGRSMKEAAFILKVSPRTVAFHKYTMMEHLRVKNIAELIEYAIKNSLVSTKRNTA